MTAQSFNWVFTWNNPDYNAEQPNVWPDVQYAVWQHEKGESGTPHYQGYIQLTKRYRLSTLIENMPSGIHWAVRRGSHKQARDYAMKADSRYCTDDADHVCAEGCGPWEYGTPSKQGERTDMAEIAEFVKTHTLAETAEEYPSQYIRYGKGIAGYKNRVAKPRTEATELIIYWGPPHTGKTYYVEHLYPNHYKLKKARDANEPWWNGYDGQETVIADEFNPPWLSVTTLCTLIDSCSTAVEPKGEGKVEFTSKRLVIISNRDPFTWYDPKYMDPELGLLRRLEDCTMHHVQVPFPGVPQRKPPALRNKPYAPPVVYQPIIRSEIVDGILAEREVQREEEQYYASTTTIVNESRYDLKERIRRAHEAMEEDNYE